VLWIKSGDQTAAQFHPRCDAAIVALAEPEMDIGQNKRLRQRTWDMRKYLFIIVRELRCDWANHVGN